LLLDSVTKNLAPPHKNMLKREILRFASAHQRLQRPKLASEPEDTEKLRASAAESAANLKNQPFYLNSQVIALIASNPTPWIDEIYESL